MPQTPESQNKQPLANPFEPDTCRNCQTPLGGTFCHACGQQAREGETLRGRLTEALTCIAAPGGRFFESLVNLLASPGDLTRAYNAGQRRRFVSPCTMLLFAMLVLHGVLLLAGGPDQSLTDEQAVTSSLDRADRSLTAYAGGEALETPGGPAILRGEEEAARSALSQEERRERALSTQFFTDQARQAWNPVSGAAENRQSQEPSASRWTRGFTDEVGVLPGLFPVLGWLMIPLMLPAMLLLFRPGAGTSAGALAHTRFLANALAFGALALAASTILVIGGTPWVLVAVVLAAAIGIHSAFHIRGAFSLDWVQTVPRTAALLAAGALALLILTAGVTLFRVLL